MSCLRKMVTGSRNVLNIQSEIVEGLAVIYQEEKDSEENRSAVL